MRKFAKRATLALALQTLFFGMQLPAVQPAEAHLESQISFTEEQVGGKTFCVSRQLIHSRPEHVWQVLSDYANAPRVFPQVKKCVVLEDHNNRKVLRQNILPSGVSKSFEYVLEVTESAPRTMEWHRISGDFKAVDGFWKLEPMDSGRSTLVTYSSYVNGGFFIPQMLIKRQAKTDMPQVMAMLKQQSENGIQIASHSVANRAQ